MKTQNIIQASVNVIKLVSLRKGDLFKTLSDSNYDKEIRYNIVTELYNDGENSFIEVLQYTKSYDSVDATIKVFKGVDDIALFPTTVEEVSEYFNSAINIIKEKIEDKKKELQKTIEGYERAKKFVDGELTKQIQSAEFSEQTQDEYNSEKTLKEAKLKELSS